MRISDWSSDVCSSDLTVKGYAQHEEKVLTEVTNARAKVGQTNFGNDSYNDGDKLKQYAAAQGQLSSALSRLLVESENYPQLKADGLFRDLHDRKSTRLNSSH